MNVILVATALLVACFPLPSHGALSGNSLRREMVILRSKIDIIYDMLATECPSHSHHFKRDRWNFECSAGCPEKILR